MRVPRSLQEDYLNVMRTLAELTAERSDSPSMEALAARCGISVERVLEAIELRFIEELTQSEIATQVGVSQMCVSRVLARTLGRLRLWARAAVS